MFRKIRFQMIANMEWRVKTKSSIGLPLLQVRLPAERKSVKGGYVQITYKNAPQIGLWKICR
jgi:hypothetical protein